MNKKELRYAFNELFAIAEKVDCSRLHHKVKDRHEDGQICPVEYHLARQVSIIKKWLEDNKHLQ